MSIKEENELLIEESNIKIVEQEQIEIKEVKKKEEKMEKKAEVKETKKKIVAPKLFFKENDKIEISLDAYHNNETGELSFVVPSDNTDFKDDTSLNELFNKVVYKFWFTRIPYDKLNRYRSRSMIYNSEDQNNTINELRLREFFLIFHLVDWNITDENGEKIELTFDMNKTLSDESLKLIYSLPSSLIDTVLTTFERKLGL